jgi:hypothetical protein
VKPFITAQEGMENEPRPEVGDEDVVLRKHEQARHVYYILERFGEDNGYRSDHFATLPDSTADEMREEEREAIVNLETVLA